MSGHVGAIKHAESLHPFWNLDIPICMARGRADRAFDAHLDDGAGRGAADFLLMPSRRFSRVRFDARCIESSFAAPAIGGEFSMHWIECARVEAGDVVAQDRPFDRM